MDFKRICFRLYPLLQKDVPEGVRCFTNSRCLSKRNVGCVNVSWSRRQQSTYTFPLSEGDYYNKGPDQLIPATSVKTWQADTPVGIQRGSATDHYISIPTAFKQTVNAYPGRTALIYDIDNK